MRPGESSGLVGEGSLDALGYTSKGCSQHYCYLMWGRVRVGAICACLGRGKKWTKG